MKRFQTKTAPQKQFFKWKDGEKKYFYDSVSNEIDERKLSEFLGNW